MWKRFKSGKKSRSEDPSDQDAATTENASTSAQRTTSEQERHTKVPESSSTLIPSPLSLAYRESSGASITSGRLLPPQNKIGQPMKSSQDQKDASLGLLVLHAPPERTVDILFIHGLGGSSLGTWSHKDPKIVWPQAWIPKEIPTARVLTFGYNARFASKKEQAVLTIGDFATDLLFRMKYEETGTERLGQVPIIVVAHSMGGLVFKRAIIQGHLDDKFGDIVSKIKAVLFLATPHRGTDLAETLHRILTSSMLGHSAKDYVKELARTSPTIDELNESFRHHASKLQIFSFYETLKTPVGPMDVMILDKRSSIMGYPNETPQPLMANHNQVCKFASMDDPNYRSIIGALRSVVDLVARPDEAKDDTEPDLKHLSTLLGVSGPPEDDMAATRALRKPGTCQKLLARPESHKWLLSATHPLLWVSAPPGSGKSLVCSYVIDHLLEAGHHCAYFFFKHGDRRKRSLGDMLRSLAYQTATQLPGIRQTLIKLAGSGLQLQNSSSVITWRKLFVDLFATITAADEIFWVIDALDESESSKQVIQFISVVQELEIPIRVLMFSRRLVQIEQAFQIANKTMQVHDVPLPSNEDDVRLVLAEELDYLPASDDFKKRAIDDITSRAQGSFLWASLVLERVMGCHRQDQVEKILDSTPDGMQELYDRMLDAVDNLHAKEDKALARIFLSWALYSQTPLTVEQLTEIYPTEMQFVMDLKHTVAQVCGQFVAIDSQNRLMLVHHSARQYLHKTTPRSLCLSPETVNEELLDKCLVTLCDGDLRTRLNKLKLPLFLSYSATSWAFHLERSSAESNAVLDTLVRFFSGSHSLSWIQYLAMNGQLGETLGVSRRLATYIKKRSKHESRTPLCLTDMSLLETWVLDLVKIPAKFGSYLAEDPSLIYKAVPALSPASSAIYQNCSQLPSTTLSVSGISNRDWDDYLTSVSFDNEDYADLVAASPLYLAVATHAFDGSIMLWDTTAFQHYKTFEVAQRIRSMAFDATGSLLACLGTAETFVWNVEDGTVKTRTSNPPGDKGMGFRFDKSGTLMMLSDPRCIYKLATDAKDMPHTWRRQESGLAGLHGNRHDDSPIQVEINDECTEVVVAYRSCPMEIWTLESPEMVALSKPGLLNYPECGPGKVVWHPSGTALLGYSSHLFKWNLDDNSCETFSLGDPYTRTGIQCSPDGRFFVCWEPLGYIQLYDVASMSFIYALMADYRTIRQIRFSSDNTRLYDLRKASCHIWEPSCLLRLADATSTQMSDTDDTTESVCSDTDDEGGKVERRGRLRQVLTTARRKRIILQVAAGSQPGDMVVYENLERETVIYRPPHGPKHKFYGHNIDRPTWCFTWDAKQVRLAYGTSDLRTCIKEISTGEDAGGHVSLTDVYISKYGSDRRRHRNSDDDQLLQLLFSPSGDSILIYKLDRCQIISLPDGGLVAEHDIFDDQLFQWKQHPSKPGYLFRFAVDAVTLFTWNLEEKLSLPLKDLSPTSEIRFARRRLRTTIDAFPRSYSSNYLLMRTTTPYSRGEPDYSFKVLPTETIYTCSKTDTRETLRTAIRPITLTSKVEDAVGHALGILPSERLMFLDKNLWVCTASLRDNGGDLKRHFFIPRNWAAVDDLRQCEVLQDGTLVFPAHGKIVFMKGDLD